MAKSTSSPTTLPFRWEDSRQVFPPGDLSLRMSKEFRPAPDDFSSRKNPPFSWFQPSLWPGRFRSGSGNPERFGLCDFGFRGWDSVFYSYSYSYLSLLSLFHSPGRDFYRRFSQKHRRLPNGLGSEMLRDRRPNPYP